MEDVKDVVTHEQLVIRNRKRKNHSKNPNPGCIPGEKDSVKSKSDLPDDDAWSTVRFVHDEGVHWVKVKRGFWTRWKSREPE